MRRPALPRWALRPRLWMLLIVVAVVAVGTAYIRRWGYCMDKASYYRRIRSGWTTTEEMFALRFRDMALGLNVVGMSDNQLYLATMIENDGCREYAQEKAHRCDELRQAFEQAAYFPFLALPVEPVPGLAMFSEPIVVPLRGTVVTKKPPPKP